MVFSLNIVTLVLRLHMFLYPGEVRSHPGVVARLAVVATPVPGTYNPWTWRIQRLNYKLWYYLWGKPFSLFFHVLKPFHMLSEVHLSLPDEKYTLRYASLIDLSTRFRAKIFKPEEGPSRDLPKHCKISRRIVDSSTLWSWNAHLTRSCPSNGYFILWFCRFSLKSVWCCIELHCNDTEREILQNNI